MLCPLVGCKGPESMNYWEIDDQEEITISVLEKTNVNETIVLTKLELSHQGETMVVEHLNEIGWVDDTADPEEFLCKDIDYLIQKMLEVRAKHTETPVIVHCSAGIGRTGTLIAIFNIVESLIYTKSNLDEIQSNMRENSHTQEKYPQILDHPMRISIFGCVRKLRESRGCSWSRNYASTNFCTFILKDG